MFSGGGISNGGGTLTLTNTTVSGNSSNQDGGGIFTATDSNTINLFKHHYEQSREQRQVRRRHL
jgi:predicted outer membrane repeat protein